IGNDFGEEPSPVRVAAGETAVFHCKPPRGEPEPTVQWAQDGETIQLGDPRRTVSLNGDLTISPVESRDAGSYTCLAFNKGGERESDPAILTVLEKPRFLEMPNDHLAYVDQTVELKCRATGDPAPTIQWHREEGRIEYGRARQLDDGTLRIEKVQVGDEGVYVCEAQNSAGTVEAVGRLAVQTQPSFLISPKDITVAVGRTAALQCVVTGNPKPTVFWHIGDNKQLLFPDQRNGPFEMSQDGTLRIHDVSYDEQGIFTCEALNIRGKVNSSASVTVVSNDDRLPPVIIAGPQNQTMPPGKVALLKCVVRGAKGAPAPQVRWYKDGRTLMTSADTRMAELNSGTLQISDVRKSDTGMYKCKAISETGETDWQAKLSVTDLGPYHRALPQSAFPGAPSKLRVSDIADTSVHLTWTPSDHSGQTDVEGFVVEYFSPQTSESWKIASDTVSLDGYTVKDLRPDTKYAFMVRARSMYGLGPPSPVSDYITTREKRRNIDVKLPKEEIAKELRKLRIELKRGRALNATHIRLKWEIRDSLSAIEGYLVNVTYLIALDPMTYGQTEVVKVTDHFQLWAIIGGLRAASWYQLCVKAYAGEETSPWSNSINVHMPESTPSRPPQDIVIHKEENSFNIRWSPPETTYQNGEIIGYDIDCLSEADQTNCSRRVMSRAKSVVISNVAVDGSYRIRVAARTSKGRGVWSKEIIMEAFAGALGPGNNEDDARDDMHPPVALVKPLERQFLPRGAWAALDTEKLLLIK
ncbi:roundabout-like protein 2, partial [Plakobranchus ocellatus]